MNINVDMKLIHKSTIALSYIVWYRLQNVIFILRVGCDMNFRENAISLADKLRSPEDQVNYLQKNRIFITSFNCLVCDIVCERVNWKSGTNYFYFRCPNYLLERSIRQSVLFGENFFLKPCLVLMIQSQEWYSSSWQEDRDAHICPNCVSLTLADGYFKTSKEKKTCCHIIVLYHGIFRCPF